MGHNRVVRAWSEYHRVSPSGAQPAEESGDGAVLSRHEVARLLPEPYQSTRLWLRKFDLFQLQRGLPASRADPYSVATLAPTSVRMLI